MHWKEREELESMSEEELQQRNERVISKNLGKMLDSPVLKAIDCLVFRQRRAVRSQVTRPDKE